MKPSRDATALAASLSSAAAASLPLPKPSPIPVVEPVPATIVPEIPKIAENDPKQRSQKVKILADTVAISLRPQRSTLERYTLAAADRTKKEGRVISAQQLMLEVLETGPKVEK